MKNNVKVRTLYDYFKGQNGELSEEEKEAIDILFSKLSMERQANINDYINGLISYKDTLGRKASNDISLLKKQFKRYQEKGYVSIRKKVRKIYDYFKGKNGELSKEEKEAIDILFSNLSIERQEGIKGYMAGKYRSRDVIGKKASPDIQLLQSQFKRYQERGYIEKKMKIRKIYDYFRGQNGELSKEEKEVIDTLFHNLPIERQKGITGYITGKYRSKDAIGKKASSDIQLLKSRFRKYQETGFIEQKVIKIYDYFEGQNGELSKEEKEIIDILFSNLSLEDQIEFINYISGVQLKRKEVKQVKTNIESMNNKLKEFRIIGLKKIQVLLEAMKIIEISFYKLGYTKKEYQEYKRLKEEEILTRGIKSTINLLNAFITESYYFIKTKEESRTL